MGHEPKTRPVMILAAQQGLPALSWIRALAKRVQPVVVLDGLGGDAGALERAGAHVVRHSVPLGIGRCMKSGLNACLLRWPDCPGALLAATEDAFPLEWIKPMIQSMRESPMTLSLGIAPLTADTPKRQARDRRWAARLFSLINGTRLSDVRPALRAAPAALMPRLAVAPGEGEDYLLNMVFHARADNMPVKQVELSPYAVGCPLLKPIHWFSMVWTLVRFLLSSLASFGVDYGVFTLLYLFVSKSVTFCTVGARIISSFFNYMINRKMVFKSESRGIGTLVRYYALVAALLAVNVLLLKLLSRLLSLPVLICKPIAEVCVYCISYWVQRDVVFRKRPGPKGA